MVPGSPAALPLKSPKLYARIAYLMEMTLIVLTLKMIPQVQE